MKDDRPPVKKYNLKLESNLPLICLAEEMVESRYHSKERGVELLQLIFDKSPEIKVLYAIFDHLIYDFNK